MSKSLSLSFDEDVDFDLLISRFDPLLFTTVKVGEKEMGKHLLSVLDDLDCRAANYHLA